MGDRAFATGTSELGSTWSRRGAVRLLAGALAAIAISSQRSDSLAKAPSFDDGAAAPLDDLELAPVDNEPEGGEDDETEEDRDDEKGGKKRRRRRRKGRGRRRGGNWHL